MGIVEDVLVTLDGVVVMTYFVIVESSRVNGKDMVKDILLLGRPFIKSTRMIVNLHDRTCTFEVYGKQRELRATNIPYTVAQVHTKTYMGAHIGPLYTHTYQKGRIKVAPTRRTQLK